MPSLNTNIHTHTHVHDELGHAHTHNLPSLSLPDRKTIQLPTKLVSVGLQSLICMHVCVLVFVFVCVEESEDESDTLFVGLYVSEREGKRWMVCVCVWKGE